MKVARGRSYHHRPPQHSCKSCHFHDIRSYRRASNSSQYCHSRHQTSADCIHRLHRWCCHLLCIPSPSTCPTISRLTQRSSSSLVSSARRKSLRAAEQCCNGQRCPERGATVALMMMVVKEGLNHRLPTTIDMDQ
jgi:hypothetical protein